MDAQVIDAIKQIYGFPELNTMQLAVNSTKASALLLVSPTGTGKTLAYSIAVYNRIGIRNDKSSGIETVVIAPTRELVRQIFDVLRPLCSHFGDKIVAVYGGNSFKDEQNALTTNTPRIVIATPGRLVDHISRKTVDLSTLKGRVYDEYDKTLEMGFSQQIDIIEAEISRASAKGKKPFAILCSATRLSEIQHAFSTMPFEEIDYSVLTDVKSRLKIYEVPSPSRDKLATLAALLRNIGHEGQTVVFVNHRESAERVYEYLHSAKISAVLYHGGLEQRQREMALARFAVRAAKVMVATDLAGRGLDIDDIASVIHYHPARDEAVWTHRNGRSARVDRSGSVYVITGPEESNAEYVNVDETLYIDMTTKNSIEAEFDLVYFDRGKKDKISRGDILGFAVKTAGMEPVKVGKIIVASNYSLLAVSAGNAAAIINAVRTGKLKGLRVRATLVD